MSNFKRKICIDCRMLNSGGIGTYLESLIPFFLNDYECLLIGNKKLISEKIDTNLLKVNNSTILNCKIKTFSIKELLFFPKFILKEINQCDIYYTPYCNIPSGIKIQIFSTIHDIVFLDINGLASKIGTIIRKFFYQYAINKSKLIFTVSNFSSQRIKEKLNIKNKKIIVTYNSVPEWFIDINDKTNEITKNNNILFVGNIKKHKGLRTLLKAFKIICKNNKDLKLTIVGNSENFRTGDEEIIALINQFEKGRIEFTGRINNEELKQYYKSSKLLVQPSLYEGFGMPPLEALTCGTNVVLSDITVFKEIYKDFPVVFFKPEDENDLSFKILNSLKLKKPVFDKQIYSFKKTYSIIKKEVEKNE